MKRIILIEGLCIALFQLLLGTCVWGADGQAVLDEIQKQYEKTGDIEAKFVQEYSVKGMGQVNRGEGKVYFKKKGMMRWDYTVPNQKLISDGHRFWFYQPSENQVYFTDLFRMIKEKTPLAFLAGEGNLSEDFTLIRSNENVSENKRFYIIELAPKEPITAMSKLVLNVDPETWMIFQTEVYDALGNVTRIRFQNIKTNVGTQDSLFKFVIPKGTEIINLQGSSASKGSKPAGK